MAKTNPCTQGPGIYGTVACPSGTCNLSPGLYFLTGIWTEQNTGALLKGTGVTLYATCGTTAAPAGCALTGHGRRRAERQERGHPDRRTHQLARQRRPRRSCRGL